MPSFGIVMFGSWQGRAHNAVTVGEIVHSQANGLKNELTAQIWGRIGAALQ